LLDPFIIIDEFHNLSAKNIYGIEKIKELEKFKKEKKEEIKEDVLGNVLDDENKDVLDDENDDVLYDAIVDTEQDNVTEKDPLNVIIMSKYKTFYMSATPRIYELENTDNDCPIDILGKIIYKMDFKTAIEKEYITPYRLLLPITKDESGNELEETLKEIKTELKKVKKSKKLKDADLSKKCAYLFECIKKLGTMKCIIYFQNCEEIEAFTKLFNLMNKYYYFYDYTIDSITYKDTQKKRIEKLALFTNNTTHSFLCCVSILNECLDVKKCNSIYITYNSKSKVSNIQRMSRALRLDEENSNKKANIILWADELSDTLTFMSSIKEIDLNFNEKVRFVEFSKDLIKYDKNAKKSYDPYVLEYNKIIIDLEEYKGFNWYNMLNKVIAYIDEFKKRPSSNSKQEEVGKIGGWIRRNIEAYEKKRGLLKNQDLYNKFTEFMNVYGIYLRTLKQTWYHNLQKTKDYIDEFRKRPPQKDKDDNVSSLGTWVSTQLVNYEDGKMNDEKKRYKTFTKFLNEYSVYFMTRKDNWLDSFQKTKEYIDKFKKRPTRKDPQEKTHKK